MIHVKKKKQGKRYHNHILSVLFYTIRFNHTLQIFVGLLILIFLSSVVVYTIEHKINSGFISFFDSIWWTIVTISTIGYGDKVPMSVWGKSIAIFVIFSGMGIMAAITGRFATFLMERHMKEEKGLLDYSFLKGHLIICGWKHDMNHVLIEILEKNPSVDPINIVLLNTACSQDMEFLYHTNRLTGIKYVHGDCIEESELRRAGVGGAEKIIVLADSLTNGDYQLVDSKTVMTVMSIKNINKKAYVCAELLETRFEKYLRIAHCDEILITREYFRAIVASASLGVGLSQVISSLICRDSGVAINAINIPEEFIDKPYKEFRDFLYNNSKILLIGILENTGNILLRKQEALQQAQKNADLAKAIPELRNVKSLLGNNPILHPDDTYIITRFCRGIIIERTAVCV